MSKRDDGGHAFPLEHPGCPPGMSLRDWFAGQVIGGICANPINAGRIREIGVAQWQEDISAGAYQIADQMLAARKP